MHSESAPCGRRIYAKDPLINVDTSITNDSPTYN